MSNPPASTSGGRRDHGGRSGPSDSRRPTDESRRSSGTTRGGRRATSRQSDTIEPAGHDAAAQAAPDQEGAARGRPGGRRRPRRRPPRGRGAQTAPGPAPDAPEENAPAPLDRETLDALRDRIDALGPAEAERMRHRLERSRDGRAQDRVARAVASAENRIARRRAALPHITYPATLPVTARREDIAEAIRDHQVVIVAGETGSGKTTQIPKICLELGRGVHGMIGHTQPRRLAARTVAARIAEELGVEIGGAVGYAVRFTDQVGDSTMVKLMTDGILLAELAGDKDLARYDTLIIDEAHERSLNVDFILGYLKRLLPRRPDLKVVITSATIDPERFARHFGASEQTPAPIVEVSGRTYPVEVRYRPVVDPDDPDADPDREQTEAIGDAVAELQREGPGDVLVFLPGEREIRDTADALERRQFWNTEILPLYARLSTAEQQRVWQSHAGNRVVLATNVAETSLTVPGIRYVVDTGTARISRYSRRLKVQRLPIEKISQASANQRSGRCGRTSDGIAIRLYAEDDFDARPEFTDPEILRTNLASVVLQMIALDLGEIAEFPFVEPPDRRAVADGLDLLHELGALRTDRHSPERRSPGRQSLTAVGESLSRLPVDPRLGRMLVEAHRNGCLREVLVITAALSVQDPRERPAEAREAADAQHRRFSTDGSDFLAYLRLWDHLDERREALSGSKFRRELRDQYLHYLRVREWWDLHGQLRQAARSSGMDLNERNPEWAAHADRIHQSVLAGLLSQVGLQDPRDEKRKGEKQRGPREYLGARGAKFAIWPGSSLAKKPPRWAMAAELVETTRLWARTVAPVQPDWIEPLAAHLVKKTYSEPHWSRKRASAVATERVTLHGIPLVADRTVAYGAIDAEVSREEFLRHALVEGDWDTRHRFFHANRELLDDAEELEHRARRRDLVVDEDTLFAFYDGRIPAHVVSGKHFDTWWRKESKRHPDLLDYTEEMLATEAARGVDRAAYPDHVSAGGLTLPLSYAFEPGHHTDGVTVDVPVAALHQVDPTPFTWQVPGLREELVTALIKTLPRTLRRNFSPAPDHARAALARLRDQQEPLLDGLERELGRMRNVEIGREDWELERLPEHLTVTFRVLDAAGAEITRGTDLEALRRELAPQVREELASAGTGVEASGLTGWTIGDLPRELPIRRGSHTVTGFPGLVDRGTTADVRVFATAAERDPSHHRGARRLLLRTTASPVKQVQRGLDNAARLALSRNPHGALDDLLADCTTAAADHLVARGGGDPFDQRQFDRLAELLRMRLPATTLQVLDAARGTLEVWHRVQARLGEMRGPATRDGVDDVRAQVDRLVRPGFVTDAGATRLGDVRRYLQATELRLDKLHADPGRDARWSAGVAPVEREYRQLLAALPDGVEPSAELREIGWMIEELRVSLFAHPMKTRMPVSVQRVERAIDELPAA